MDVPEGQRTMVNHCATRMLKHLGSSKGYPLTMTMNQAYFSTDPEMNPTMHDWNVVVLMSMVTNRGCDHVGISSAQMTSLG